MAAEADARPIVSDAAVPILKTLLDNEQSLYAQRDGDLHLDSLAGPVVGRIHAGAFVSVAPVDERAFAVMLPGFRRESSTGPTTIVAFVDRGTLGPERVAAGKPPIEGRLLRDVPPGLDLYPTRDAASAVFANPLCGDARVVVQGHDMSRVSQYFGGVELLGWAVGALDFKRGPFRCSVRTVSREDGRLVLRPGPTAADRIDLASVPAEFVTSDPYAKEELSRRMKLGGSVHWLTQVAGAAQCREWRFERMQKVAKRANGVVFEGLLNRVEPLVVDGDKVRAAFSVGYTPRESGSSETTLAGPHWFSRDGKKLRGGYSCMIGYAFVGATSNALRMLPGSAPDARLVAWHPDDEEHWFTTKQACLDAAQRANEVLGRDPEAHPPGGVHVDCFDELRR
ncbi:MAG TPA: hypothetical protein VJN18_20755 [Polyangiaceae bacterium]|nr:hypothetical protein [Polyangiaceae bacterium]